MDDFIVGPQSDEKEYTWWDYEMEFSDKDFFDEDEVSLCNDTLATSTKR